MPRKRLFVIIGVVLVLAIAVVGFLTAGPGDLVLTGIVTTDDVVISPLVGGQIENMFVKEGDSVTPNEILARLVPSELQADTAYYSHNAAEGAVRVLEGEASVRLQTMQTQEGISQAGSMLAAAVAQQSEAAANLSNAKTVLDRYEVLGRAGAVAEQDLDQQRTAHSVAKARAEAADRQVGAQRAALALAEAAAEQVSIKRSQLGADQQQRQAAAAQQVKAGVRLAYTQIRSPIRGVVDVRAALGGEVVNAGQPIVTLINPDSLWVRADVEETYIDRIRLGDTLTVRLPSGTERQGMVFYRGADAGFATQRDVSRSKRDIKTFEIRLRVDNHDRRLAVGMTAYVLVPPPKRS
jgi:multidrug resistance efflux pump